MTPSYAEYVEWRKAIFDPKGDCDPIPFSPAEADLLRAARAMGPVEDVTKLKGGTFVKAYFFETPEGPFVLKVPVAERFAPSLEIAAFAAQQAVDMGGRTVVPILTDTSHYLTPFTFQIEPFVEDDKGESPPWPWNEVEPRGYGPLDPRDPTRGLFDTWAGYLTTRLSEHLDICTDIKAINRDEAFRIEEIVTSVKEPAHTSLLHNDLSSRNVIGSRVIDWESCISGDPLYELASWYGFHADVETRLSDRTYWLYYLRIVVARTVHRHRFSIPEHPVHKPASARIQSALKRL